MFVIRLFYAEIVRKSSLTGYTVSDRMFHRGTSLITADGWKVHNPITTRLLRPGQGSRHYQTLRWRERAGTLGERIHSWLCSTVLERAGCRRERTLVMQQTLHTYPPPPTTITSRSREGSDVCPLHIVTNPEQIRNTKNKYVLTCFSIRELRSRQRRHTRSRGLAQFNKNDSGGGEVFGRCK